MTKVTFRIGWGYISYKDIDDPGYNTLVHSGTFRLAEFNITAAKIYATRQIKKCPELEKIMSEFFPREYTAREDWGPWSKEPELIDHPEKKVPEYVLGRFCHLKHSRSFYDTSPKKNNITAWVKIVWPKELGKR